MVVLIVLCLRVEFLCCWHLIYVFIFLVNWPPNGKIAARSAYDIFS